MPWNERRRFLRLSLSLSARAHLAASLSPSASGRKRFSQDKKRTGARAQTHNEKTRFSLASESVCWSLLPFSTSNPRAQEKEILNCQKDGEEGDGVGGVGRGWGGLLVLSFTTENLPSFIEQNTMLKQQHGKQVPERIIKEKSKLSWSDKD